MISAVTVAAVGGCHAAHLGGGGQLDWGLARSIVRSIGGLLLLGVKHGVEHEEQCLGLVEVHPDLVRRLC
jgi:hypothetical protein